MVGTISGSVGVNSELDTKLRALESTGDDVLFSFEFFHFFSDFSVNAISKRLPGLCSWTSFDLAKTTMITSTPKLT